jgi:hypothetical protein
MATRRKARVIGGTWASVALVATAEPPQMRLAVTMARTAWVSRDGRGRWGELAKAGFGTGAGSWREE